MEFEFEDDGTKPDTDEDFVPIATIAAYCEGTMGDGSFFVGISGRDGWDEDVIVGWAKGLCGEDTENLPSYTVDLLVDGTTTTATGHGYSCDY